MTVNPEQITFAGKLVLITGAAQGIGEATARSFAAFGASVALCDREADRLAAVVTSLRASGTTVHDAVLDVRDEEASRAWVSSLPPVDVLVNNAGGGFHAPVLGVSSKGQTALVNENFTSVTTFVRACVPTMPMGSSIINVTSVEAFRAAPGFGIYAAMKAAVEQLTRTLALELSDRRIRVNTIAPDAIPTPGDETLAVGTSDYGLKVPLGWGEPDDCAGAALFLASPLAKFVTGTTIHVDGGSDAARGWRRNAEGNWEP